MNAPSIEDLEKSISDLKYELHSLNRSLQENYEKSQIFLGVDLPSDHGESDYKRLAVSLNPSCLKNIFLCLC